MCVVWLFDPEQRLSKVGTGLYFAICGFKPLKALLLMECRHLAQTYTAILAVPDLEWSSMCTALSDCACDSECESECAWHRPCNLLMDTRAWDEVQQVTKH